MTPWRACVRSSSTPLSRLLAAMAVWAGCAGLAFAAPADERGAPPAVAAPPADPAWEVSVAPYAWLSGLKGDIGVSPRIPPAQVDLSFSDIFDALDFAGMAVLQARRDRFVVAADVAYIDLGASENVGVRDPDLINVKLDSKLFLSTIAAGYRVVDRGDFSVDLVGGGRIVWLKTGLDLSGPIRTLSGSTSKGWVDPVVGARVRGPLSDRWSYAAYGDVGGFGVASDLTWQLYGVVQYRLSDDWALAAGWRHLKIDYKHDGFVFDAAMDGPILGAVYRF